MGNRKYIETPEVMWNLFQEFKEELKKNPYTVRDWVGGMAKEVTREKERPLTWVGFEAYLYKQGIINDLGDYESNKNDSYGEFSTIITRIKKEIEADQFEGASAGIYQQNIIARKLGLTEKVQEDGSKELTIKVKYEKKKNDNEQTD